MAEDTKIQWAVPNSADESHNGHCYGAVAGGESGPGARPCDVAWICGIVEQCAAAG